MYRLVDRGLHTYWYESFASGPNTIIIASPFISAPLANKLVLSALRAGTGIVKIITDFDLKNFLHGSSSIKSITQLHEYGAEIYHLRTLHSKIVFTDGLVSIGSQNLTHRGTKTIEASVVSDEEKLLEEARRVLDGYLRRAFLVDAETLYEVDALIQGFSGYGQAENIEAKTVNQRIDRTIRVATWQHLWERQKAAIRSDYLPRMGADGREISEDMARKVVEDSAWWDHPIAERWVRARKDRRYVTRGGQGWRSKYGGNALNISEFFRKAARIIDEWLSEHERPDLTEFERLRRKLCDTTKECIEDNNGEPYDQFRDDKSIIKVSNHGYSISDLADTVEEISGINYLRYYEELVLDD